MGLGWPKNSALRTLVGQAPVLRGLGSGGLSDLFPGQELWPLARTWCALGLEGVWYEGVRHHSFIIAQRAATRVNVYCEIVNSPAAGVSEFKS